PPHLRRPRKMAVRVPAAAVALVRDSCRWSKSQSETRRGVRSIRNRNGSSRCHPPRCKRLRALRLHGKLRRSRPARKSLRSPAPRRPNHGIGTYAAPIRPCGSGSSERMTHALRVQSLVPSRPLAAILQFFPRQFRPHQRLPPDGRAVSQRLETNSYFSPPLLPESCLPVHRAQPQQRIRLQESCESVRWYCAQETLSKFRSLRGFP